MCWIYMTEKVPGKQLPLYQHKVSSLAKETGTYCVKAKPRVGRELAPCLHLREGRGSSGWWCQW